MRTLPPPEELYHDAVSLTPDMWMEKYAIHPSYKTYIDYFSFEKDGTPKFETNCNMDPELFRGWARLFLLGTQIVSEVKGAGGRNPADIEIGTAYYKTKTVYEHSACLTRIDSNKIIVTAGYIQNPTKL